MSALLLPELAREMAGSNRRVAETLEAESRRLEKLRGQLDEAEALPKRAARSAREATTIALSRKAEVLGIWQNALIAFEDGLSGEQAKELVQNVRDIIDSWGRLARDGRAMLQLASALGSLPEGLEGLSAAEQEIEQVKAAVEKMHAFMTRARPPVDPALLARGGEEIAQGRYRTGLQIRASCPPAEGPRP